MYQKKFSWKFSATSHGKGVVDGVGGRVKSLVHAKAMSLGKDCVTVQDAESFCSAASRLCEKTTVIYVASKEIETYKSTNPFETSVQVDGITKMHVICTNGQSTHLWLNSLYQLSNEPNISLGNHIESESFESEKSPTTPAVSTVFSYHDVVKVVKGNFIGFYAIVTETADTSKMSTQDELEINYLKKSFGKWIIN